MIYKLLTTRLLAALFLSLGSTAMASTTWYVNGVSGSDSNNCTSPTTACKTIGHAISLASSGDSIKVAAATYIENLTIGVDLNVVGSGAKTTIIDGGGVATVVNIPTAGTHVALSKLTIRNGLSGAGAGISNNGILKLLASVVSGNTATFFCNRGCFAGGGGIFNAGSLTIRNSTVANNVSDVGCLKIGCRSGGGGILNDGSVTINKSTVIGNNTESGGGGQSFGGGIYHNGAGTLKINNSTLASNSVSSTGPGEIALGGAIASSTSTGKITITNSTLMGNTAGAGGGIFADVFGSGSGTLIISNTTVAANSDGISNGNATITLQNSIVANNKGGNCNGTTTSNGYNLSSDATCSFNNTGDLNNTNPKLGPLQNNGGPTQTMALPSGSPAIDAGNPNGCTDGHGNLLKTDQRGKPRPDKEDTGGCDMGAYESQSD